MKKQSQLTNWLQTQKSDGQVDSAGAFSIDRHKAWEKLGAFQLPFETAWILKLVQALNSCHQSKELKVTQNRVETVFRFRGIKEWTHKVVEVAVFNPEQRQDRDLDHLAVAIRALAQLGDGPFSLTYSDGGTFVWKGSAFSDQIASDDEDFLSNPSDGAGFTVTVSHFRFGESASYLSYERPHVKQTMVQIAKTLNQYCFLSPCPVSLDSVNLQNLSCDPVMGRSDAHHVLHSLMMSVTDSPALQAAFKPNEAHWNPEAKAWTPCQEQAKASAVGLILAYLLPEKSLGKVCYYKPSQGPLEILWLSLGVVVQRERLQQEELTNLSLLASAEGLNTDLSGLYLREDHLKWSRLDQSIKVLSQNSESILANLKLPRVSLTTLDSKLRKSTHVTSCASGCVMGPVAWIIALFFNYANNRQVRKIAEDLPDQIRASAEKLFQLLERGNLSEQSGQRIT